MSSIPAVSISIVIPVSVVNFQSANLGRHTITKFNNFHNTGIPAILILTSSSFPS